MSRLRKIVESLEELYGRPAPPVAVRPFEMILLENVAYLVDDARRTEAFQLLRTHIGLRPEDILKASADDFKKIDVGGINKQGQIEKLIFSARLVVDEYDSNLDSILDLDEKAARKALQRFPAIGEPAAEKILLFNRKLRTLALDSNALRIMTRLGYGEESKNYAAMYKSVKNATAPELSEDFDWLINASQLIRRQAKETCKTTPRCEKCILLGLCSFGQDNRGLLPSKPARKGK